MRVTGLGHAGLFIETAAGTVLCDPWVNPAFFGSWFPFPDNTDLDWDHYGRAADYLYVSHLHRDHFDAENLRRNVRKDLTVLLPPSPPTSWSSSCVRSDSANSCAPKAVSRSSAMACAS
ncbi:MBL fold metallo-hydrolase [Streptomyces sp. FXJ1.4098]|nr:MBL fold metallo-hydrolase [Streptomyces sp. FXJ1.4098]